MPYPHKSSQVKAQEVLLGLGSNAQPEFHIQRALQWLHNQFGMIERSLVYESAAFGFKGDPFHNLVVAIPYAGPLQPLRNQLKAFEDAYGRDRTLPKFSSRNLDLDILTYGNLFGVHEGLELPRADCFLHSYVLRPLAELRPHHIVPGRTLTWEQLWEGFVLHAQPLRLVEHRYGMSGELSLAL